MTEKTWNCLPERLDDPLKWRKPARVFVNSMSDLFHEGVDNEFIADVFAVMAATPQHSYQILTKRPERMLEWFNWLDYSKWVERHYARDQYWGIKVPLPGPLDEISDWQMPMDDMPPWPLPNVWLGVSCEDQQRAGERIPILLQCPAAVRWVSAEPLLSHLDLLPWLHDEQRTGVSRSGSDRVFQRRRRGEYLASHEVDGRGRFLVEAHPTDKGGAESFGEGGVCEGNVSGRVGADAGCGAQDSVDVEQRPADSAHDGNQSYRREQAEQSPGESGTRDTAGKRDAFVQVPPKTIESAGGGGQRGGEADGHTSFSDKRDLEKSQPVATGDCEAVQDLPVNGIGDRVAPHMEEYLNWVVIGGESGPGARACNLNWIESIVEQCKAASVPVFVKQLGAKPYEESRVTGDIKDVLDEPTFPSGSWFTRNLKLKDPKGGNWNEWPEHLRVREYPA